MLSKPVAALCAFALALQGCATASKDITATYVSPLQYQSYDCDQLAAEIQRIQGRVGQLGGRLDEAANNDKGIMAVGLILFWPALFALGGTKQQEAEYARLKGEYDAIEQQAIQKKCKFSSPSTTAGAPPATDGQATSPTTSPVAAAVPPTSAPSTSPSAADPAIIKTSTAPSVPPVASPAAILPVHPNPPSASTPRTPPVQQAGIPGESKYLLAAEKFAKANNCSGAVATLTIRSAGSETFTVTCNGGDPLVVRCDFGECRALN